MNKKIKWGILGPGSIANSFVKGLMVLEDAEITAVGSRTKEKADVFASKYGIKKSYGSYDELVHDPNIDIIYISTPHMAHKECTLLCLKSGKAVLCEKPFTVNFKEAEEVVNYARESKLFLMEAMWTRFLPIYIKVREWLSDMLIGDIKVVKADFGFRCEWNPESRLLNPNLGGGALLDVGVYTISFVSMILGINISEISSFSHIGETGVDEEFAAIIGYNDGKIATVSGAIRTNMKADAWIYGTEGSIHIPDFWHATSAALSINGKSSINFNCPYEATGYNYEAAEAMRCLKEGKIESNLMPLNDTLSIVKTMDVLRSQWQLKYPFEL